MHACGSRLAPRYGLPAYWLVFALHTVDAARDPGFVPDPASVPFPWSGVVTTWLVLALLTGWLYLVPRPHPQIRWWQRALTTFGYVAVLLFVLFSSVVTDRPGHHYVPGRFAALTLLGLLLLLLAHVVALGWQRVHRAAERAALRARSR